MSDYRAAYSILRSNDPSLHLKVANTPRSEIEHITAHTMLPPSNSCCPDNEKRELDYRLGTELKYVLTGLTLQTLAPETERSN